MIKTIKKILILYFMINSFNLSLADENFFNKGLDLFKDEKFEDARFMFERSIVFNPKDTKSYLYLAKIFRIEKNKKEEEKNIETTLLLDPTNEEATYILMEIELKKSNYSKVKELTENFAKICKTLCKKNDLILKELMNLEPKNES